MLNLYLMVMFLLVLCIFCDFFFIFFVVNVGKYMIYGVGRKKYIVVQIEVGNFLQDGFLFGLEGLSVGSGVGLL